MRSSTQASVTLRSSPKRASRHRQRLGRFNVRCAYLKDKPQVEAPVADGCCGKPFIRGKLYQFATLRALSV